MSVLGENWMMTSLNILLDELMEETGGLGRFQIMIIGVILGSKISFTWSMLIMSFAGVSPKWWCTGGDMANGSYFDLHPYFNNSVGFMNCSVNGCDDVHFDKSLHTIVNEV